MSQNISLDSITFENVCINTDDLINQYADNIIYANELKTNFDNIILDKIIQGIIIIDSTVDISSISGLLLTFIKNNLSFDYFFTIQGCYPYLQKINNNNYEFVFCIKKLPNDIFIKISIILQSEEIQIVDQETENAEEVTCEVTNDTIICDDSPCITTDDNDEILVFQLIRTPSEGFYSLEIENCWKLVDSIHEEDEFEIKFTLGGTCKKNVTIHISAYILITSPDKTKYWWGIYSVEDDSIVQSELIVNDLDSGHFNNLPQIKSANFELENLCPNKEYIFKWKHKDIIGNNTSRIMLQYPISIFVWKKNIETCNLSPELIELQDQIDNLKLQLNSIHNNPMANLAPCSDLEASGGLSVGSLLSNSVTIGKWKIEQDSINNLRLYRFDEQQNAWVSKISTDELCCDPKTSCTNTDVCTTSSSTNSGTTNVYCYSYTPNCSNDCNNTNNTNNTNGTETNND